MPISAPSSTLFTLVRWRHAAGRLLERRLRLRRYIQKYLRRIDCGGNGENNNRLAHNLVSHFHLLKSVHRLCFLIKWTINALSCAINFCEVNSKFNLLQTTTHKCVMQCFDQTHRHEMNRWIQHDVGVGRKLENYSYNSDIQTIWKRKKLSFLWEINCCGF